MQNTFATRRINDRGDDIPWIFRRLGRLADHPAGRLHLSAARRRHRSPWTRPTSVPHSI